MLTNPCIETDRLILRRFREDDLLQNVYFWKDGEGNPLWKDTYIYALLNNPQ